MDFFDVIIIGGGLGGLTAGAKLSREGKRVLLLEQHSVPGGYATTFRHKEFRVEAGLHEMDGFGGGNPKQKIFTELDIFNHVKFPEIPHFYRAITQRKDVTVPHDLHAAKALLLAEFPHEAAGLDIYFGRMEQFRKYRPESEAEAFESIGGYLDRLIGDADLKLILLGNLMAFSDDPYLLSMDYYAQAQGAYYNSGSVFIEGGSQVLSDYLAGYIKSHGGEVLCRHLALEILMDSGLCSGVKFRSLRDGTDHTARTKQVVVNAALPQVATTLLPEEFGRKLMDLISDRTPGASLYTLYLCFDRPLKEIGNPCYCTCVYGPDVNTLNDIGRNSHGRFEDKTYVLTDYSHIRSGLVAEGKGFAALVAEDYLNYWDGMTPEDYKQRKAEVTASFLSRLEQLVPGLNRHLVWYDAATARTMKRYTLNTDAAVYGFAQNPGPRSKQRISPVANLHIASAWDKFGGGFSGVVYSGYFAALEALRQERLTVR